jgi:hypothetical protein
MCDQHAHHIDSDYDLCPDHKSRKQAQQKGLFDEPPTLS